MRRRSALPNEDGAILPLFALLIVLLLVFAAFAVDLGSAWAQRRTSQTAADASVMAAALQYLRPSPATETGTFDLVNDYANANLNGPDLTIDDWTACQDIDRPTDYEPLGTSLAWDYPGNTSTVDIVDCISIKQVDDEPAVLRVRLPITEVPTAFARVIGIENIAVSAFAEAEIRYIESSKIIPFALPADAGTEECLNTPPSGQLPDVMPGCGSDSGNFGFLDLNWYGSPDPHDNLSESCGQTPYPNFDARTPMNVALGIDHILTAWPDTDGVQTSPLWPYNGYDGPPIDTVVPQNQDSIVDSCTNAATDVPPQAAGTKTGNQQLIHDGMLGGPFGLNGDPGRLRQPSPVFPGGTIFKSNDALRLSMSNTGTWNVEVDNIGLWEYLDSGANTGECLSTKFNGLEGRELTDQMHLCLEGANPPTFIPELVDSPRFSLVPVLNYTSQTGDQNWAVITMKPIYIQTTWYTCTSNDSLSPWCMFEPSGFDTYTPPNPPLSVTLTDPTDLSVVGTLGTTGSSDVPLSANANTTGGGSVAQVEFFVDGKSVFVDTSSPYSFVWDSSKDKDGPVTISAVATKTPGGDTATDTITVALANTTAQSAPAAPASFGKSIYFNPGEGETPPCMPNKANDDCIEPTTIEVDGMTALVIETDWLHPSSQNAIGGNAPFEVYLRR